MTPGEHPRTGAEGIQDDLTDEARRIWPGAEVRYTVTRTGGHACRLLRPGWDPIELGNTKSESERRLAQLRVNADIDLIADQFAEVLRNREDHPGVHWAENGRARFATGKKLRRAIQDRLEGWEYGNAGWWTPPKEE